MSLRTSLAWTYLAQAICFFVTFGSTIVVARLVSPRDFGIFAMANAVTIVIGIFMQLGLARYITREAYVSKELLQSLFTVNVIMTAFYVVAILLGAGTANFLFASPELGRFLMVFAIFPLIGMFEFIPSALCAREMKFGWISAINVTRAVALAVSTISLALLGYEYMSFAWSQVVVAATTCLFYNLLRWRPDVWRLRLSNVRTILTFGLQMVGIGGTSQISARAGDMILGSILGYTNLGLFNRAANLPANIIGNVYGVGGNVIFSRMSIDLRETGSFHETYLRFMRLILGLLWPAMLGIAILAQPLINLLYGQEWHGAAAPLSLLAIAAAISMAIGMTTEVFILRHETKRQLRIEGLRAALGIAFFTGGAFISLWAAALAKVAEALVAFMLYRKPMSDLVGGSEGALTGVYVESLVLAVAAVVPTILVMQWSGWSPATPIFPILAAIILGGLAWAVLLLKLRHPLYVECARLLGLPH